MRTDLGLLLVLVACAGDAEKGDSGLPDTDADIDTAPTGPLSFAADIESRIVEESCSPCHYPTGVSGGLTISYDNLVGVVDTTTGLAYVEPGSPEDSYLWHKVSGTQATVGGLGGQMPPGGLSDRKLADIEQWILDGALP